MCEGLEECGVFGLRVKPWRLICGAVVGMVEWVRLRALWSVSGAERVTRGGSGEALCGAILEAVAGAFELPRSTRKSRQQAARFA